MVGCRGFDIYTGDGRVLPPRPSSPVGTTRTRPRHHPRPGRRDETRRDESSRCRMIPRSVVGTNERTTHTHARTCEVSVPSRSNMMPGLIPIMVGCVFYLFSVIIIIECISKYAGLSLSSRTQCLVDEQCDDIILLFTVACMRLPAAIENFRYSLSLSLKITRLPTGGVQTSAPQ